MSQIETVHARQILDSRGNPTVEVDVVLRSGAQGRAAVPSGASTGEFEATELRDGGDAWMGKGVSQRRRQRQRRDRRGGQRRRRARPEGARPRADRPRRDAEQGAPRRQRDPRRLARAARAAAAMEENLPLWRYLGGDAARILPVPMMNVLNGGAHADNSVDFQEFMVVPVGAPSFAECLRMGAEVFHHLKKWLHDQGMGGGVGDEGGFAPNLESNEAALDALMKGIEAAGYTPGEDIVIALDPATSEIFDDGRYDLEHEGRELSPDEMAGYWGDVCSPLPDPLDRGRDGRGGLGRLEGPHRSCSATRSSSWATTCSSPTPSGSSAASTSASPTRSSSRSTRSARCRRRSTRSRWRARPATRAVMSHRSGETEDTTIADLAVATGLRPDQDRRAVAQRPRGEVQPAAAHRGGARRRRGVPGPQGLRSS